MIRSLVIVLLVSITSLLHAQKIATLAVELPTQTNGIEVPVNIALDKITFIADSMLNLVEVQGNSRVPVPFQIDHNGERTLHWLVSKSTRKKHTYELVKGKRNSDNAMKANVHDGMLTLQAGDKKLVNYCFKTIYPPSGIDTAYKRSGFIHPLWSPKGQVLTRIQPPDHYHHYGIWNPWTHVLFEGDTVDFWNIRGRQGTVRFADFVSRTEGDVFSEFQALQEHVVFKKDGGEKIALNELQSWRVYRPDQDYYIADVTIQMNCAGESPFKILEYRYAGFGWRATEQWTKDNSEVITSEGKTRKDADGSTARWCIVQGKVDGDHAGIVMMSYPGNYNHPEPLRIWPENSNNGRGDMFANFAPTKNMDWLLTPGHTYALHYRLIVFNGRFTKEKAESAWQYFAKPPKVTVKMN